MKDWLWIACGPFFIQSRHFAPCSGANFRAVLLCAENWNGSEMLEVPVRDDEPSAPVSLETRQQHRCRLHAPQAGVSQQAAIPIGENAAASSISTSTATAIPGRSAPRPEAGRRPSNRRTRLTGILRSAQTLERELETKTPRTRETELRLREATDEFLKEVERLNREEATPQEIQTDAQSPVESGAQPRGRQFFVVAISTCPRFGAGFIPGPALRPRVTTSISG